MYQQSEMKIRLNNTKKGLTTVWSVDKFQSALEQMRELYQVWNTPFIIILLSKKSVFYV